MAAGVRNVVGCDRSGIIHRGRTGLNPMKLWYAEHTNPDNLTGTIHDAMRGADVFLGLSAPGVIGVADLQAMAKDPIVFAMANPTPEILPEQAEPYVAIMATGRSDYPNQINNVLCFPGIFRGALDARASTINEEMKLAAAHAIAHTIPAEELSAEYIVPSVFDKRVGEAVARAVNEAAHLTGVARRPHAVKC
jgi:malate dehydrogenase (oxaloacetate-decarboxylating)